MQKSFNIAKELEPLFKPMRMNKFISLGICASIAVLSAANWQILIANLGVLSSIPAPVMAVIAFFLFASVQYFEIQPELMVAAQDDPKTLLRRMVAKNSEQLQKDRIEEFRQNPNKILTAKMTQIAAFAVDLLTNWFASTVAFGAAPITGFSQFLATGAIAAISINPMGLVLTLAATFGIPFILSAAIKDNKY
jgi:hypothetical protein